MVFEALSCRETALRNSPDARGLTSQAKKILGPIFENLKSFLQTGNHNICILVKYFQNIKMDLCTFLLDSLNILRKQILEEFHDLNTVLISISLLEK